MGVTNCRLDIAVSQHPAYHSQVVLTNEIIVIVCASKGGESEGPFMNGDWSKAICILIMVNHKLL